jgi:hypothetical protein
MRCRHPRPRPRPLRTPGAPALRWRWGLPC